MAQYSQATGETPDSDSTTPSATPAEFRGTIIDRSHTDLEPILDDIQALKHNQNHALIWMVIGPHGSGRKEALKQIDAQARDLLDQEGVVVRLNLETILRNFGAQTQLQSALRTLAIAIGIETDTLQAQEATDGTNSELATKIITRLNGPGSPLVVILCADGDGQPADETRPGYSGSASQELLDRLDQLVLSKVEERQQRSYPLICVVTGRQELRWARRSEVRSPLRLLPFTAPQTATQLGCTLEEAEHVLAVTAGLPGANAWVWADLERRQLLGPVDRAKILLAQVFNIFLAPLPPPSARLTQLARALAFVGDDAADTLDLRLPAQPQGFTITTVLEAASGTGIPALHKQYTEIDPLTYYKELDELYKAGWLYYSPATRDFFLDVHVRGLLLRDNWYNDYTHYAANTTWVRAYQQRSLAYTDILQADSQFPVELAQSLPENLDVFAQASFIYELISHYIDRPQDVAIEQTEKQQKDGTPPPLFVGRQQVLRELAAYLCRQTGYEKDFVFVQGNAGSGKTALITYFVHLVQNAVNHPVLAAKLPPSRLPFVVPMGELDIINMEVAALSLNAVRRRIGIFLERHVTTILFAYLREKDNQAPQFDANVDLHDQLETLYAKLLRVLLPQEAETHIHAANLLSTLSTGNKNGETEKATKEFHLLNALITGIKTNEKDHPIIGLLEALQEFAKFDKLYSDLLQERRKSYDIKYDTAQKQRAFIREESEELQTLRHKLTQTFYRACRRVAQIDDHPDNRRRIMIVLDTYDFPVRTGHSSYRILSEIANELAGDFFFVIACRPPLQTEHDDPYTQGDLRNYLPEDLRDQAVVLDLDRRDDYGLTEIDLVKYYEHRCRYAWLTGPRQDVIPLFFYQRADSTREFLGDQNTFILYLARYIQKQAALPVLLSLVEWYMGLGHLEATPSQNSKWHIQVEEIQVAERIQLLENIPQDRRDIELINGILGVDRRRSANGRAATGTQIYKPQGAQAALLVLSLLDRGVLIEGDSTNPTAEVLQHIEDVVQTISGYGAADLTAMLVDVRKKYPTLIKRIPDQSRSTAPTERRWVYKLHDYVAQLFQVYTFWEVRVLGETDQRHPLRLLTERDIVIRAVLQYYIGQGNFHRAPSQDKELDGWFDPKTESKHRNRNRYIFYRANQVYYGLKLAALRLEVEAETPGDLISAEDSAQDMIQSRRPGSTGDTMPLPQWLAHQDGEGQLHHDLAVIIAETTTEDLTRWLLGIDLNSTEIIPISYQKLRNALDRPGRIDATESYLPRRSATDTALAIACYICNKVIGNISQHGEHGWAEALIQEARYFLYPTEHPLLEQSNTDSGLRRVLNLTLPLYIDFQLTDATFLHKQHPNSEFRALWKKLAHARQFYQAARVYFWQNLISSPVFNTPAWETVDAQWTPIYQVLGTAYPGEERCPANDWSNLGRDLSREAQFRVITNDGGSQDGALAAREEYRRRYAWRLLNSASYYIYYQRAYDAVRFYLDQLRMRLAAEAGGTGRRESERLYGELLYRMGLLLIYYPRIAQQRDDATATTYFDSALQQLRAHTDVPSTQLRANIYNWSGFHYRVQGRTQEARKAYEHAVETLENTKWNRNIPLEDSVQHQFYLQAAITKNNLAYVLNIDEQYSKADTFWKTGEADLSQVWELASPAQAELEQLVSKMDYSESDSWEEILDTWDAINTLLENAYISKEAIQNWRRAKGRAFSTRGEMKRLRIRSGENSSDDELKNIARDYKLALRWFLAGTPDPDTSWVYAVYQQQETFKFDRIQAAEQHAPEKLRELEDEINSLYIGTLTKRLRLYQNYCDAPRTLELLRHRGEAYIYYAVLVQDLLAIDHIQTQLPMPTGYTGQLRTQMDLTPARAELLKRLRASEQAGRNLQVRWQRRQLDNSQLAIFSWSRHYCALLEQIYHTYQDGLDRAVVLQDGFNFTRMSDGWLRVAIDIYWALFDSNPDISEAVQQEQLGTLLNLDRASDQRVKSFEDVEKLYYSQILYTLKQTFTPQTWVSERIENICGFNLAAANILDSARRRHFGWSQDTPQMQSWLAQLAKYSETIVKYNQSERQMIEDGLETLVKLLQESNSEGYCLIDPQRDPLVFEHVDHLSRDEFGVAAGERLREAVGHVNKASEVTA